MSVEGRIHEYIISELLPDHYADLDVDQPLLSILLTSNRVPEEWPDVFGEPLLAAAGLDWLTHQAQVVVITGTRFRAHGPRKEVAIESTPS